MKFKDFFSNYEFLPNMGNPRQLSIFICGLWEFETVLDEQKIKDVFTKSAAANSIDVINGDYFKGVFLFLDIKTESYSEIKSRTESVFNELIDLGARATFLTNELWAEQVIFSDAADEWTYILGYQIGDNFEYGDIVDDEVILLNSFALDYFFETKAKLKLVQS